MSLNTNGWDYIYNLRFSKVNEILSKKKTDSNTALQKLKTSLANVLSSGTTGSIVVKSNTFGEGYLNVPAAPTFVNIDGVPTNIVTKLRITKIEVDNSKITTDYTSAPSITINGGGGSGATATASSGVLFIKVTTPGSGYTGTPNVSITGGNGSGAEAIAIMTGAQDQVEFIKVTKLGSGYGSTNPPIVTIDGTGGATAVASFGGISIELTNSGSGYSSTPTITLAGGGGGSGAIATAKMGVEIDPVTGGSGFSSPPLIDIPNNGTELGATAFVSLAFSNNSLLIGAKAAQSAIVYAKKAIKDCIDKGLKNISGLEEIISKDIFTDVNVLDYCLAIVGEIVDQRHDRFIAEDLSLKFLFDYKDSIESDELAKSIISNYFTNDIPQREATDTDQTYVVKFKNLALVKLKKIEKEKIKNRVKAALQFVDNQIIYNINLSPTLTTSFKTLEQLGNELENNKEGFLESMIGLLTALSPQSRIFDICGILHDNHPDSQQFPLKKIKLNTGPFKLETGGSDSLLKINIPIFKGLFYFGKDSKKYDSATDNSVSKFNIPLLLNLDWMRGAFKDTLPSSPPTNYVNLAVDNIQLETNISLALPGISDRNKQIVRAFIDGYIQNFIKNPDPDIQFFDLVKQPYSYHDVFSHLNMGAYEALGLDANGDTKIKFDKTKNNQKWLFPTRTAYGAKDEITLPADSKNSILSICSMIKGKQNNDASYTDLNAIPEGATSALIIERSVFGEHMVVPKIAENVIIDYKRRNKAFFEKKSAYTFANKDDCYMNYADFKSSLTYIGFLPLIDWLSYPIGYPVYHGKVLEGKANIAINEDHINVLVKDTKYMYSWENHPKITQEYLITIARDEQGKSKVKDKNNNTREFLVKLVDNSIDYFHLDFTPEIWYTIMWPLIKSIGPISRKFDSFSGSQRKSSSPRLYDYLPSSQKFLKKQLKLLILNAEESIVEIQKAKNNKDLNESEQMGLDKSMQEMKEVKKVLTNEVNKEEVNFQVAQVSARKSGQVEKKTNKVVPFESEKKKEVKQNLVKFRTKEIKENDDDWKMQKLNDIL
jgi:hypothetical protein